MRRGNVSTLILQTFDGARGFQASWSNGHTLTMSSQYMCHAKKENCWTQYRLAVTELHSTYIKMSMSKCCEVFWQPLEFSKGEKQTKWCHLNVCASVIWTRPGSVIWMVIWRPGSLGPSSVLRLTMTSSSANLLEESMRNTKLGPQPMDSWQDLRRPTPILPCSYLLRMSC